MKRRRRGFLIACALLACSVVGAPTAHAQTASTAVPLDEILQRIDAAQALADQGSTQPSPATMEQLRNTLGFPTAVVLPEGATVWIPADPLLEDLTGDTGEDFALAKRELELFRSAAAAVPGVGDTDVDQALQASIGASGTEEDVGPQEQSDLSKKISEFFEALGRAIAWPFEQLGLLGGTLVWGVILVIVGVLVWAVLRWRRNRGAKRRSTSPVHARGEDPKVVASELQVASQRGDMELAVRIGYRLLIARVAARGLLRDPRTATAGECRTVVAKRLSPAYSDVADATRGFEGVVFGKQSATPELADALERAASLVASS